MSIAEENIDFALVTCRCASEFVQIGQVQASESEISNNAVSNRHQVGWGGHFGFFNRRKARMLWNDRSSGNKVAVQAKRGVSA